MNKPLCSGFYQNKPQSPTSTDSSGHNSGKFWEYRIPQREANTIFPKQAVISMKQITNFKGLKSTLDGYKVAISQLPVGWSYSFFMDLIVINPSTGNPLEINAIVCVMVINSKTSLNSVREAWEILLTCLVIPEAYGEMLTPFLSQIYGSKLERLPSGHFEMSLWLQPNITQDLQTNLQDKLKDVVCIKELILEEWTRFEIYQDH